MAILAEGETAAGTIHEGADQVLGGRRAGAAVSVDGGSPVVHAGERLVHRIELLVEEIGRLRADNDDLRQQVREAVALLDRAASAVGEPRGRGRARAIAAVAPASPRRRRARARGTRGRATPPEVTAQVVEAAISKLGVATASEIAAEITRAGVKVSGRAIRFLAERAGAETFRGEDGQRRYRIAGH